MKYKLAIRLFEESDISSECPNFPDEDYEMHINAFVEEIENMNCVSYVLRNDFEFTIETNNQITEKELKELMKPIFSEFFCDLRFVSLEGIK